MAIVGSRTDSSWPFRRSGLGPAPRRPRAPARPALDPGQRREEAPAAPPRGFTVRAAFSYRKRAGRREFVRASLAQDADGTWEARKFQRDGAGMLSSLTDTDGLVELEEDRIEVVPGDVVRFHPHEALW